MTALEPTPNAPAALVRAEVESARRYFEGAHADATIRAYRSDWAVFEAWASERGLATLPALPETVATFIAAEADAGRAASTLGRRVSALRWVHERAGYEAPTKAKLVVDTLKGARRARGVRAQGKRAATADVLHGMLAHVDATTTKGKRDRALLLLGFLGAFRRSELVALDVADVTEDERGLVVLLRRSKTDQAGAGREVFIPRGHGATCPAAALRAWLVCCEAADLEPGPVFRSVNKAGRPGGRLSTRSVAQLVKDYAERAGHDPAAFSGHSLRAGFVTTAADRGRPIAKIAAQTGHRSLASVRHYMRAAEGFADNAAAGLL